MYLVFRWLLQRCSAPNTVKRKMRGKLREASPGEHAPDSSDSCEDEERADSDHSKWWTLGRKPKCMPCRRTLQRNKSCCALYCGYARFWHTLQELSLIQNLFARYKFHVYVKPRRSATEIRFLQSQRYWRKGTIRTELSEKLLMLEQFSFRWRKDSSADG